MYSGLNSAIERPFGPVKGTDGSKVAPSAMLVAAPVISCSFAQNLSSTPPSAVRRAHATGCSFASRPGASSVPHEAVGQAGTRTGHTSTGALVGEAAGRLLVEVDAEARRVGDRQLAVHDLLRSESSADPERPPLGEGVGVLDAADRRDGRGELEVRRERHRASRVVEHDARAEVGGELRHLAGLADAPARRGVGLEDGALPVAQPGERFPPGQEVLAAGDGDRGAPCQLGAERPRRLWDWLLEPSNAEASE